ncbi:hypothetical protein [Natrinema salifodinae]|uniref:Uncharacterized protein n=1 Tax=Natrinema salifodinae TaxID=1202768 RepID=A0A1I0P9Q0_9EURY|nr:hypothetical protein [Natrinema salifodinae]SEW11018.1 hypothetical protein SAMN05216285_2313 [Natrinema salifodinae]
MIGAYTIGKKAVTFGYRRYGIPGAIASGGAALAGYVIVRRALQSAANSENVDSAIDADELRSAVENEGLSAVADRDTLDQSIDADRIGSTFDMDDVQSSAESETEEFTDNSGDSGGSE